MAATGGNGRALIYSYRNIYLLRFLWKNFIWINLHCMKYAYNNYLIIKILQWNQNSFYISSVIKVLKNKYFKCKKFIYQIEWILFL